MALSRFPGAAALLVAALASPSHAALVCDDVAYTCTLDLSTVTVTFGQHLMSFTAEGFMSSGTDGYVNYPWAMPALTTVDSGGRAGFSFDPMLSAFVGGSGVNGFHEGTGRFQFSDLTFTAKPGYSISNIEFGLSGYIQTVGNGSVYTSLPGGAVFTGDNFESSGLYAAGTSMFIADFTASAYYQEGEDGTADDYGTASVGFTQAYIVAHVVPEPETWMLMLAGIGALMALGRRRRASPG